MLAVITQFLSLIVNIIFIFFTKKISIYTQNQILQKNYFLSSKNE